MIANDGEELTGSDNSGMSESRASFSDRLKSSAAPMSPTTQQMQHSPNRRIKSMPLIGSQHIKVIYFRRVRSSDTLIGAWHDRSGSPSEKPESTWSDLQPTGSMSPELPRLVVSESILRDATPRNETKNIFLILEAIDPHKQKISKNSMPIDIYGGKATTRKKLLKTSAGYSKSYAKSYEVCRP